MEHDPVGAGILRWRRQACHFGKCRGVRFVLSQPAPLRMIIDMLYKKAGKAPGRRSHNHLPWSFFWRNFLFTPVRLPPVRLPPEGGIACLHPNFDGSDPEHT